MNSSHNLFAMKILSFAFPKEFVAVKSATRIFSTIKQSIYKSALSSIHFFYETKFPK